MKAFWQKGNIISNFYKTKNIIFQLAQVGRKGGRIIIIGDGHSMSVIANGLIKEIDHATPKLMLEKNFDENDTVIYFYYTFECKGMEAATKDLVKLIVQIQTDDEIWLIGHSKCGLCFYNAIKYIARYNATCNIKLVTISTPFAGTIMPSKRFKNFLKRFNTLLNLFHKEFFIDHAIDNDILPKADFLETLPAEDQVVKYCMHYNICSAFVGIGFGKCKGFFEKFCKFISWATFFKDGVVKYESQYIWLNKHRYDENFAQGLLFCGYSKSLEAGINLIFKRR